MGIVDNEAIVNRISKAVQIDSDSKTNFEDFTVFQSMDDEMDSLDSIMIANFCKKNDDEFSNYYQNFLTSFKNYKEKKLDIDSENQLSAMVQSVFIFENWQHEQNIKRQIKKSMKTISEKTNLDVFFEASISIYQSQEKNILLETDDSINYLEYSDDNITGNIYTLSFNEIFKLYNVTGTSLFKYNVRNGMRKSNRIISKQLRASFQSHFSNALYEVTSELSTNNQEVNTIRKVLENQSNDYDNNIENKHNFWFYHNGITICTTQQTDIYFPGNFISLETELCSVINGAQTITLLFQTVENFKEKLFEYYQNNDNISYLENTENEIQKLIDRALQKILVKTIVLKISDSYINEITVGLNTQIPIQEEDKLATNDDVKEINSILKKVQLSILKPGEETTSDISTGINLLTFVKKYYITQLKPGFAKNYKKSSLSKDISDIKEKMKSDKDSEISIPQKIKVSLQIDKWWGKYHLSEAAKYLGKNTKGSSINNVNILSKHAKNYFESFSINEMSSQPSTQLETVEDISQMYYAFLNTFTDIAKTKGIPLEIQSFKNDELFLCYTKETEHIYQLSNPIENLSNFKQEITSEFNNTLNENITTENISLFFKNFIDSFSKKNKINIDNYKIIIKQDNTELSNDFPLSSQCFTALYELDSYPDIYDEDATTLIENNDYLSYNNSKIKRELNKEFFLFKLTLQDSTVAIKDLDISYVKWLDFLDKEEDAKNVYQKTIKAFCEGNDLLFPQKSKENCIYVAPQTRTNSDTFVFTNKQEIDRRTFRIKLDNLFSKK
ncbi:AIPR family protein [Leuconostoc pseudomesenteroides]|uniref:AIPR family protein n=1 Tax=Leuconostoc pseudomesenteroides TaxID=33968 RepID=UPI00166CF4B1|nr:AIPR family protein [Leuconostoc pseudomesenteroides]